MWILSSSWHVEFHSSQPLVAWHVHTRDDSWWKDLLLDYSTGSKPLSHPGSSLQGVCMSLDFKYIKHAIVHFTSWGFAQVKSLSVWNPSKLSYLLTHPTAFGWPSGPQLSSDHTSCLPTSKTSFDILTRSHRSLVGHEPGMRRQVVVVAAIPEKFRKTGSTFSRDHRLFVYFLPLECLVLAQTDSPNAVVINMIRFIQK